MTSQLTTLPRGVATAPLPRPDFATDAIDRLPNELGDLPDAATSTVDPLETWTKIPDAPVKVREDSDFVLRCAQRFWMRWRRPLAGRCWASHVSTCVWP